MANQNRIVELQIKLKGAESIAQLEEVTSEINNELKQISNTSQSFGKMQSLAQQANSKLKEVGESVAGITSTEKAEAVNKLGQGLVGAFQAAAGASLLFGEKTSEELQKVIQKVGGLFAITDGLKKVTEAFSAKNIAGLKATVKGFQESTVAAKLFGTTTKAAISATGLGLIVVILASIIANFDKVKVAIKNAFDKIKDAFPFLEKIQNFVDDIKERFGSLGNIIKGVGAAIASIFTKDTMAEAFNETVEEAKALTAQVEEYNRLKEDGAETLEYELEMMRLQGETEDKLIEKQIAFNNQLIKNLESRKKLDDEGKKELNNLKNANALLNQKLANYQKETAEKKKQADITEREKANQEALKKIEEEKALALQRKNLLELQYQITVKEYRDAIDDILANEEISLDNIEANYNKIGEELQAEYDKVKNINDLTEDALGIQSLQIKNIEDYIDKLDELAIKAAKIAPPTEDSEELESILNRITNEYAKQRDIIKKSNDLINSYTDNNTKNQGIVLSLSDEERNQIVLLEGQKKLLEEANKIRLNEISAQQEKNQLTIDDNKSIEVNLVKEKEATKERQKWLVALQFEAEANAENAKTEAERLKYLDEAKNYQLQALDNWNRVEDINRELEKLNLQNNNLTAENVKLNEEALYINENIVAVEKEQGEIIAQNAKVYLNEWQKALYKVQGFIENNSEQLKEIGQGLVDLTMASFDLAIANAEAEAEKEIKMLEEKAEAEIAIEEEKINKQKQLQEDYADSLLELDSMLADADGERYDDILAQIELEKQAKQDAINAEIEAENQKAAIEAQLLLDKQAAEKKANQLKKTQSIVQAVIDTALSVVSALKSGFPLGLVMAGVYAAMGAVQIATISKQPTYAEGTKGTPKTEWALVGEEGPELAYIPKGTRIYSNPQTNAIAEMMASMRGYASGTERNVSAAVPNIPDTENMLDYKRIGDEVRRALSESPLYVSWIEGKEMGDRVTWVTRRASTRRASIGKR